MNVQPIKTRVFKEKESLLRFIQEHIPSLPENSVLGVTSKVVALAEGRTVCIEDENTKEKVIRAESQWALKTKYVLLTLKDGMFMPSAGVDESNANGKLVLLPADSFGAAEELRTALCSAYGITNLGVLITDSRTLPLRAGVTGIALGYAGFSGLNDYRSKLDIFGRPFAMSRTNVADGLAAAAVLIMGEGAEQVPLVVISGGPVTFKADFDRNELLIDPEDDMYQPLFGELPKSV